VDLARPPLWRQSGPSTVHRIRQLDAQRCEDCSAIFPGTPLTFWLDQLFLIEAVAILVVVIGVSTAGLVGTKLNMLTFLASTGNDRCSSGGIGY
jgi:hypothetical protein